MNRDILDQLVHNAPFAYAYHKMVYDIDGNAVDYEFIDVNKKFEEVTGLKSENILGKRVTVIIPQMKDNEEDLIEIYGKVAAECGEFEFERFFNPLNKWYKIKALSFEKDYFAVFFIDVTHEKELENAKEEISFRKNLLDNVGEAVIATNVQGNIIYWNKGAEKIYGWNDKEVAGKNIVDIMSVEDKEIALSRINNPRLVYGEYMLKRKNGEVFPAIVTGSPIIDKLGKIIGRIGVSSDITDKKYTEEKIVEINEKLDKAVERLKIMSYVIEQSPSSILITDKTGKIEYANPTFSEITGYSREEVMGKNPKILNAGYHSKEFYKEMWGTLLRGEVWTGEILNKTKDGKLYWEYAVIVGIKNEEGEVTHFAAVKDNITELKKAHDEIIKAKGEADAANRAKSIFLANISHEIRTPLNAIIGFAELMDRGTNIDMLQKEYTGIIIKSGYHLLEIINSILEMSKIESGKVFFHSRNFDVVETFENIFNMFKEKCRQKGVEFSIDTSKCIIKNVFADESKIKQIFINLIGNSVKFTKTGQIRVHISTEKKDDNSLTLKGKITDTGPGISEDEQKNLFKFFQQATAGIESGGGTGIGLAITKKLVEMMNGKIEVKSIPGAGTIFEIEMEIKQGEKTQAENENTEEIEEVKIIRNGKIYKALIVDDNEENLKLVTIIMKELGFDTYEAADGKTAVEKAKKIAPDIIITDVKMPGMSGIEAIQAIRKEKIMENVPVVFMSASIFEESSSKVVENDYTAFIRKPFTTKEFFRKLGSITKFVKIVTKGYVENQALVAGKPNVDDFEEKNIPEDLKEKILSAAKSADIEELYLLSEEVLQINTLAGEKIKEYISEYSYEEIVKLFER